MKTKINKLQRNKVNASLHVKQRQYVNVIKLFGVK